MYNAAIRVLLLLALSRYPNMPPAGTSFWVTNTGARVITNNGQRIVFRPR